jgi:cell wall-associated NlpC family hydrolase
MDSRILSISRPRRWLIFLPLLVPILACGPVSYVAAPDSPAADQSPSLQLGELAEDASICEQAARLAYDWTRNGAIYSQGGHLPGDPIDLATGTYYSRTGLRSFDCSGLTWRAFKEAGLTIGGATVQQINDGVGVNCHYTDTSCMRPGDLILLGRYCGQPTCHVAIYLQDGYVADCLNHHDGCRVWRPAGMYYSQYFIGVRRLCKENAS